MFKKLISMVTASVLLATVLSVIAAAPANAYASNSGSSTGLTNWSVTPDANGDFFIPAGVNSVNIFLRFSMVSGSLSGFNGSLITFETELKNPSNTVITRASTSSTFGYYDSSARYFANTASSSLSGTLSSSGYTLPNGLTSLSISVDTYFGAGPGATVPSGTYNFTGGIKRGGVAYNPVTNERNLDILMPIEGRNFTIPNGTISRIDHNVVTCVNRSLVTSSDTLTMNLVTTGSLTTDQTRFLSLASNVTSLGSATTLSLASVNLNQPIAAAASFTVGNTTAGTSFTSDLSITKGDGTEVSARCGADTPAAPTVVFTTTTRLTATFNVSTINGYGQCQLFLASDLATPVRTSFSSAPGSDTTRTCTFSSLTQGTAYVVKVSEAGFFSFGGGNFNVNREMNSPFSNASQSITSGTPTISTPSLTAEQIAAASAFAAALAKAAEVVKAKAALTTLLAGNKSATPQEFANADFNVRNSNVAEKVSAAMMKLSVVDRENTQKINEIIKLEDFIDRVSVLDTRSTVKSRDLISRGLLPATSTYKFSVVQGLASYPSGSLDSMEKIEAAIKEQIFKAEAPKRRLAEIQAKIAARKK